MAKPLFMRGLLSTVLVAVSLTAGQSLARAEGFDFPALVGGIDDAIQAVTLDSDSHQVARQVIEQAAVGRVGFRPVSTLPHPHAGFVPSAPAVRLARERLADALVAAQPATSRAMILRELNSGVLQAEFARRLRAARMTTHDMADVMAAFLAVTWHVVAGVDPAATPLAGYVALRNALRTEMAGNADWKALKSSQKQELAESMAVLAMLTLATRQALVLHKDARRQEELKLSVTDAMRAYGIDLSSVLLTDAGFVPARAH